MEKVSRKVRRIGSRVSWLWLGRPIQGKVAAVFYEKIQRTIKGKKITRNGSKENPAYLVISDAGNEALKLGTELKDPVPAAKSLKGPRMFGDL